MKPEKKSLLIRYSVCFFIAALIAFIVIWVKGFFTDSIAVNVQIWADAFFVSGILLTLFAGMLFVSGEGALIGIGFVLRNIVLAFVPMGRAKHEVYADYRKRKLSEARDREYRCVLVIGLLFLAVGLILNGIWYTKFYHPSSY